MMENNENRDLLLRRAAFGQQVEAFWTSDIGGYLIARIESGLEASFDQLKVCDPKDGRIVQALQNEIWKAETLKQWLTDAVVDGLAAVNILNDD